ncbi:unnamed protein product [Amoebophrya sp. A120]|nr:unnamed protein product [Amoebophrya sp. A120]|eukprot:GSA120T00002175001.1
MMNASHPTWGGTVWFEPTDNRWHLVTGGKVISEEYLDGGPDPTGDLPYWGNVVDPYTTWGRSPAYNAAQQNVNAGAAVFQTAGRIPWYFTTTYNPYLNDTIFEQRPILTRFVSDVGGNPWGPFTEMRDPKWAEGPFRADVKQNPAKPSELLMLSTGSENGVFGLAIYNSTTGMNGPWGFKMVYGWKDGVHKGMNSGTLDQWDCDAKDPSFVVHENGTTVIAYRGTRCDADTSHDHTERVGLLISSNPAGVDPSEWWRGPYTRLGVPLFQDSEDLFMWIDKQGGTHMIMHTQSTDHTSNRKKIRGAHAYSKDGMDRWTKSEWELWPAELKWDDGNGPSILLRQQRPSLQFERNTSDKFGWNTDKILSLTTGVDFLYDPCCDWYVFASAWTAIQPVVTQCRAGQVFSSTTNSCQNCAIEEAKYNGHCLRTTTKYGECVCAECDYRRAGDNCENEAYKCYEMQAYRRCNLTAFADQTTSLTGTATTEDTAYQHNFPHLVSAGYDYSTSSCQRFCDLYSSFQNTVGCCYNYAPSSTCRWYAGVTDDLEETSGAYMYASLCMPVSETTTTTKWPYSCTLGSGAIDAAAGKSLDPANGFANTLHCSDSTLEHSLTSEVTNLDVTVSNECLQKCEEKASELGLFDATTNLTRNDDFLPLGGCCYSWQGASKSCIFNALSKITSNSGVSRHATLCYRETTTTSTTTTSTYTTTSTTTPPPTTTSTSSTTTTSTSTTTPYVGPATSAPTTTTTPISIGDLYNTNATSATGGSADDPLVEAEASVVSAGTNMTLSFSGNSAFVTACGSTDKLNDPSISVCSGFLDALKTSICAATNSILTTAIECARFFWILFSIVIESPSLLRVLTATTGANVTVGSTVTVAVAYEIRFSDASEALDGGSSAQAMVAQLSAGSPTAFQQGFTSSFQAAVASSATLQSVGLNNVTTSVATATPTVGTMSVYLPQSVVAASSPMVSSGSSSGENNTALIALLVVLGILGVVEIALLSYCEIRYDKAVSRRLCCKKPQKRKKSQVRGEGEASSEKDEGEDEDAVGGLGSRKLLSMRTVGNLTSQMQKGIGLKRKRTVGNLHSEMPTMRTSGKNAEPVVEQTEMDPALVAGTVVVPAAEIVDKEDAALVENAQQQAGAPEGEASPEAVVALQVGTDVDTAGSVGPAGTHKLSAAQKFQRLASFQRAGQFIQNSKGKRTVNIRKAGSAHHHEDFDFDNM